MYLSTVPNRAILSHASDDATLLIIECSAADDSGVLEIGKDKTVTKLSLSKDKIGELNFGPSTKADGINAASPAYLEATLFLDDPLFDSLLNTLHSGKRPQWLRIEIEKAGTLGYGWEPDGSRMEWKIENSSGESCASPESACAGAARAALGSSQDALRGLGMGDGYGERTHRTFHGEETASAGAEAQWVRPFVLYALRHTFLTRLGEAGCDAWTLARIAGHSSIASSVGLPKIEGERANHVMKTTAPLGPKLVAHSKFEGDNRRDTDWLVCTIEAAGYSFSIPRIAKVASSKSFHSGEFSPQSPARRSITFAPQPSTSWRSAICRPICQ
jgi:hypothetical protein